VPAALLLFRKAEVRGLLLPQPGGFEAAVTSTRVVAASGFERVSLSAEGTPWRVGGLWDGQHLHELACFLFVHRIKPQGPEPCSAGLVSAARATATRGNETYYDDCRDHHENSDCDPGVSAERHFCFSFRRRVVHR
jgi:hypothetical protein